MSTDAYASTISTITWGHFRPAEAIASWEWLKAKGRNWKGAKLDAEKVPWARGVCEAWDDPECREIDLEWAARLGKTLISQNLLCKVMECDPHNILEAGPNEKVACGWVDKKLYPMLRAMVRAGAQISLPPENRQGTREIDFGAGLLKAAWAGSDTSMADFDARYAHLGEVSKFPQQQDAESDTVAQCEKRTHAHPDRKVIKEGTPTFRGRCRIDHAREQGNDCRYNVPCPHCGEFQQLKGPPAFANSSTIVIPDPTQGGIVWDLDSRGRHDAELAFNTARYVCIHCRGEVLDVHRPSMMRAGIWVPKGQHVDRNGKLRGEPLRSGRIWSSQLASWYSLDFRWGDVAEMWVHANGSRERRKTYVQLTRGEAYEHEAVLTETAKLAEVLKGGPDATPAADGVVPRWAKLLVWTSDVQKDTWPWKLIALGPAEHGRMQSHIVDCGTALSWDECDALVDRAWPVEGGGQATAGIAGMDSGHHTADVYSWCKKHNRITRPVYPIKGSGSDLAGKPYNEVKLGQDKKARRKAAVLHRGQKLLHINTDFWEEEVWSQFEGSCTACARICADDDLLKQLLNCTIVETVDRRGVVKLINAKKTEEWPNDFRDAYRYGLALGKFFIAEKRRGQWPEGLSALGRATPAATPQPASQASQQRPQGNSRFKRAAERFKGRMDRGRGGRRG